MLPRKRNNFSLWRPLLLLLAVFGSMHWPTGCKVFFREAAEDHHQGLSTPGIVQAWMPLPVFKLSSKSSSLLSPSSIPYSRLLLLSSSSSSTAAKTIITTTRPLDLHGATTGANSLRSGPYYRRRPTFCRAADSPNLEEITTTAPTSSPSSAASSSSSSTTLDESIPSNLPLTNMTVKSEQDQQQQQQQDDEEEEAFEYIEYEQVTEREYIGSEWLVGTNWDDRPRQIDETWVRLAVDSEKGRNVAVWGDQSTGTWSLDVASQFLSISKEYFYGKRIWACTVEDYYYLQGTVRGWAYWAPASVLGQWQARRLGVDPQEAGTAPWFETDEPDKAPPPELVPGNDPLRNLVVGPLSSDESNS